MKAVLILYLESDDNLSIIIDGDKGALAGALEGAGRESPHIKEVIQEAARRLNDGPSFMMKAKPKHDA